MKAAFDFPVGCVQWATFPNVFLCLSLGLLLTSCGGGSGQDSASPLNISTPVSGIAVDGHLARATVFLDTNNNGTRELWEPAAFTDNDGYFSFNPVSGVDYCAADASAENAQYCLQINTSLTNAVVRIDGGYDVLTGEPFYGQMARRVSVDESASSVDSSVISPITTLLVNATDAEETVILDSLGLESEDLDVDYVNEDGVNAEILNAALKVHKTVTILSDRLEDTYESVGDELGTPNDASLYVYSQLAEEISSSGLAVDLILEDQNSLANIMDAAEENIRDLYEQKEFDLPADLGSESNFGEFSRTVEVATEISGVVDSLIDPESEGVNMDLASGSAKILESLIVKAIEEVEDDETLDNAIEFITDVDNTTLIDALRDGMTEATASVAELADNDFSGSDFDSVDEVATAATLPEDAQPFAQIGGTQVRVSDLDLGTGPNDLDDSEVEFYFLGEANAQDGVLMACVKHIKEARSDGTLGEGNTRGELLDGYWSLLNANSENGESYTMLLTITFLGATYQSILKPAGTEVVANQEYHLLRFDFDDRLDQWHSVLGFVATETLPVSSRECESRLPSRVGI